MRPIIAALELSLVVAFGAQTQEPLTRAGFGITFLAASPIGALTGTSTLYMPIPTSPTFRLEPIIGWHHSSVNETSNNSTNPNNGVSVALTDVLLGLGLFGTSHPGGAATLIYYGPRIGVAWVKRTVTDQSANSLTDNQKDWFLTFVVGAEHRISHFSIGGDAGLSYLKAGKPEFQQTGTVVFATTDAGGWSIGTTASAFVRWYF